MAGRQIEREIDMMTLKVRHNTGETLLSDFTRVTIQQGHIIENERGSSEVAIELDSGLNDCSGRVMRIPKDSIDWWFRADNEVGSLGEPGTRVLRVLGDRFVSSDMNKELDYLLFSGTTLYLMNDQGKTIDTYRI